MFSGLMDEEIRALGYRARRAGNQIRCIVFHDMEAPERSTTARNVGKNWFATPQAGKASTHYGVDSHEVIGYVSETLACYGAGGGSNDWGIHVEHAGYAKQSRSEWLDEYGVRMLDRSARLVADRMTHYGIPPIFRDAAALKRGAWGITTHREISKAFQPGGHTDPGPHFPMDEYLASVKRYLAEPTAVPVIGIGDRDGKNSLGGGRPVASVQRLIGVSADGDFGPLTERAVAAYQGRNGLTVSGTVDLDTWAKLTDSSRTPTPTPIPAEIPGRLDLAAVRQARDAADKAARLLDAVLGE